MNDREFFCKRHQAEFPTFKSVLAALPLAQFTYRPHERSPSTLDVVWTLANEIDACSTMIDKGEVHWAPAEAPDAGEAVKAFHANEVILGYRAILNEEKLGLDIVRAVIEVKITPERGGGFGMPDGNPV